MMYTAHFEHCGNFILLKKNDLALIRCPTRLTDIGDDEDIRDFVVRHGADKGVADYLSKCLRSDVGTA
jgi:hypothetical protein